MVHQLMQNFQKLNFLKLIRRIYFWSPYNTRKDIISESNNKFIYKRV